MTLLTVDAKLMPVLPLIARPASQNALVVAFGMGSAFRGALIAGLHTDAVELVPSVPLMFGYYYDDAAAVLANPNGRVIVTDGRNHLELTDQRYDIIVTDPPPPIESSGAAVISSKEYFEAGRDHLTPDGIMMQWVPFGGPSSDFFDQIRTFAAVFPHVTVVKGAGGYGAYMLGSSAPVAFAESDIRAVLARPGVLADISSAYDSPARTDRRLGRGHRPPAVAGRRRGARRRRPRSAGHGRPPAAGVLPASAAVRLPGRVACEVAPATNFSRQMYPRAVTPSSMLSEPPCPAPPDPGRRRAEPATGALHTERSPRP